MKCNKEIYDKVVCLRKLQSDYIEKVSHLNIFNRMISNKIEINNLFVLFYRELQFNNLSIIRKDDFKALRQLRIL